MFINCHRSVSVPISASEIVICESYIYREGENRMAGFFRKEIDRHLKIYKWTQHFVKSRINGHLQGSKKKQKLRNAVTFQK